MSAQGGVHLSPLWTEFLTHVCENITFLQLRLWTVKIEHNNGLFVQTELVVNGTSVFQCSLFSVKTLKFNGINCSGKLFPVRVPLY